MAYSKEFKEKVTDDLKEIGGSLDRFKSIGTRLDRIAEYTDPNNPEGLGKATDLLYEHVRNQDAVGEITGFTSSMKKFTMFLKIMAVVLIGMMTIYGIEFYTLMTEHPMNPESAYGIDPKDYLPSTLSLVLSGLAITAFAAIAYKQLNVQLFKMK